MEVNYCMSIFYFTGGGKAAVDKAVFTSYVVVSILYLIVSFP